MVMAVIAEVISSGTSWVHRRHASRAGSTSRVSKVSLLAVDGGDREQFQFQGGDDAEVAAGAQDRAEQVVAGVQAAQAAVRGDQVDGPHMVRGVTVGAGQQAQAAAEVIADHAHRRGRAVQRGQSVRGRRLDEASGLHPGRHAGGACHRVDGDIHHPARADQHAARRRHRQPVAGGLHGDRKVVPRGVFHGAADVLGVERADHQRGPMGVCGLESGHLFVVSGLARTVNGAGDRGKFGNRVHLCHDINLHGLG